jgi:uncharacterized protein with HEPN domain
MSRDEFLSDAKTIKAVAANLTIIGEAARHVPDNRVQAHSEIPWPLMTGMCATVSSTDITRTIP